MREYLDAFLGTDEASKVLDSRWRAEKMSSLFQSLLY